MTTATLLIAALEAFGVDVDDSPRWISFLLGLFILACFGGAVLVGAGVAAYFSDRHPMLNALSSGALAWMLSVPLAWNEILEQPVWFAMALVFGVLPLSAVGGLLGRARRVASP